MIILISLAVMVIDQVSKYFVIKNLWPGESIPVINGIFYITLVTNTGGAFGILKKQSWFFIITSLIAVIVILFLSLHYHKLDQSMKVSMGLILGGAVGNLIDRLMTNGHVVIDFLDFRIWPVFNIADTAITIGTCLLILNLLLNKKKEKAA